MTPKIYFEIHFSADGFIQINSNIDSLGKSVADGKKSVASAISAKGVSTAADSDFAVMSANISKITTAKNKVTISLPFRHVKLSNTDGGGGTLIITCILDGNGYIASLNQTQWDGAGQCDGYAVRFNKPSVS